MKRFALPGVLFAMACGSANAQSDITLYGVVDGGIRWVNGTAGGATVKFSGPLDSSRFGLLGSEDLGGGTKAIFRLESQFNIGNGALSSSNVLWQRDAYVGLENTQYGLLTAGRQFSSFEDLGISLDPSHIGGSDIALAPTALLAANFFTLDTRFNNSVKYRYRYAGTEASASYSFGGVAGNQRAGSSYSGQLNYTRGPFKGGIAYQRVYNADASQAAQSYFAGSSWQAGPVRLFLSYLALRVSGTTKNPSQRRDDVPQGGFIWQYTPALSLTAAYYDDIASNLGNKEGATGHKQTAYVIVRYSLSKRTDVYAEVDRNHFSGKYINDPTNLAAFGRAPNSTGITGASIGLISRF
ncbi:putative porin [Paraburkholderia unamae]|uniref:porin n=1 Tax=Paraburkholderia unamae TaxID=219649 RepID=UPI000DC2BC4C|nr:porin [Paraburkholderia unamae]RAR52666.1 putative porin [Paraburkholderia unamae]